MARRVSRGEIWGHFPAPPDQWRPVVILTRQEVIRLLHTVMVAPVTPVIRGAPSEVLIGAEEGLKRDSAINPDHVQTVEQARLRRYLGRLSPAKMAAVCSALAIAAGCDE